MAMYSGNRSFGNAARILLTASAALLISAPVFAGPRSDAAIAACAETLRANYGATEISDSSYNIRGDRHRTAYATAGLANGETIRFRCIIRGGAVSGVDALARADPANLGSKSEWSSAERYRVSPEPDPDAPAAAPPEPEVEKAEAPLESAPEFKTPGAQTGFKSPGTETRFKKPGAGTGSRFKRAKK